MARDRSNAAEELIADAVNEVEAELGTAIPSEVVAWVRIGATAGILVTKAALEAATLINDAILEGKKK